MEKFLDKYIKGEVKEICDKKVSLYDGHDKAAMLEILHILMEHYGHITLEIEQAVAEYLKVSPMEVRQVITFYTLYYTEEKAKVRFNICRTLSCNLLGSDDIVKCFEKKLGIQSGQKTGDQKFEVKEVECLGACELAPMLQVNDDEYIGNLTEDRVSQLIKEYGDKA